MTGRIARRLTLTRKLVLACAGIIAVAGPVLAGILKAQQEALSFEVASIRPAQPSDSGKAALELLPGGGLRMNNATVSQLITFAYGVDDLQLSGGPSWLGSERYDILAKAGDTAEAERPEGRAAVRERTRSLLAERFGLVVHKEKREGQILALVVAKNGPRIQPSTQPEDVPPGTMRSRSQINARRGTMKMLATVLGNWLQRPVVDRTGLTGHYDYVLKYAPDIDESPAEDASGPSVFTALQEQLGLKLESQKGPVEIMVIDRVARPTAN